jgi:zinc protease
VLFASLPSAADAGAAEKALDGVLAELIASGIGADELAAAKSAIEARLILDGDSQQRLAANYGEALAAGRSLSDVIELPARVARVEPADVERAARSVLVARRSVTGLLKPENPHREVSK